MDPNATLEEMRRIANTGQYERFLELYRALDRWLSNGGFLPTDWAFGDAEIFESDKDY